MGTYAIDIRNHKKRYTVGILKWEAVVRGERQSVSQIITLKKIKSHFLEYAVSFIIRDAIICIGSRKSEK